MPVGNRPLTSDELGDHGQKYFEQLCSATGLICNRAERDRTGWDNYVEFPRTSTSYSGSPDSAPNAPKVFVQVKTMWSDIDKFETNLSTLSHIALSVAPVFICILKMNENSECVSLHIVHIFNQSLRRILEKLRRQFADGLEDPYAGRLSWAVTRDADKIEPIPHALRNYLAEKSGPNPAKYAESKTEQLKTLGYEGVSHTGSFTVSAAGPDALKHWAEGDIPLNAASIRINDCRFGIEVLEHEIEAGQIQLFPRSLANCTIRAHTSDGKRSAILSGQIFAPNPLLVSENGKYVLFRTDMLSLRLFAPEPRNDNSKLADVKTNIEIRQSPLLGSHTVGAFLNRLRFLEILAMSDSYFSLEADGFSLRDGRIGKGFEIDTNASSQIILLLTAWQNLSTRAGTENVSITWENIWNSRKQIIEAGAFLDGDVKDISMTFRTDATPTLPETLPFSFLNLMCVAENYYVLKVSLDMKCTMKAGEFELVPDNFISADFFSIGNDPSKFQKVVTLAETEHVNQGIISNGDPNVPLSEI